MHLHLNLLAQQASLRTWIFRWDLVNDRGSFGILWRLYHWARLSLIEKVVTAVQRNPVDPCTEVGSRFEAIETAVSPQECFLHDLFRVLFILHHAKSEAEDNLTMALHQQAKSILVA